MNDNAKKAVFYCVLLAFQFGLQPILTIKFADCHISKTSMVIGTEAAKVVISAVSLAMGPKSDRQYIWDTWNFKESLSLAALPAVCYMIQNMCIQYGFTYLDAMTFNLLNQTKV